MSVAAPRGETGCAHCGLPVAPGLFEPAAVRQFCCAGCRAVYEAIHDQGLERFYDLRGDAPPVAARTTGRTYEEFDDPAFRELYCRPLPGGTCGIDLYLEGVHCAACVWLVERLPRLLDGVAEARLEFGRSRARVVFDPRAVQLSAVGRQLDRLGYPAHPYRGARRAELERRATRADLLRLGIAGACAMNVMGIAFALYGGLLHGMEPQFLALFRWTSFLVSLPALAVGGSVFFRGAWRALRAGGLHMDLPISLGILVGFGSGAWNTLRGAGDVYFDSVTLLIFLLLLGRFLQARRQRAAADAAELLHALTPSTARLLDGAQVRVVPVEALAAGARVEVRAGDTVPADGVVERGDSALDLSVLTGESRPAEVGPGDRVAAGAVNRAAALVVRVEAAGEHTRLGRLMRLVEEHAQRKAPIVQLADRLSGWFVAAVLALAAATAALWLAIDPARALDHAVALLIVTCPCALALATPLAVGSAIGQAARAGLLVKGADVLERLTHPGRFWLDKTGTLTEGQVRLIRWCGDEAARGYAAAVEAQSAHPVARALVEAVGPRPWSARDVAETTGKGIEGLVSGRTVVVGSPAFVAGRASGPPEDVARELERMRRDGLTPVVVALDGAVVACAGFGDRLRGEAASCVAALRSLGWRVGILSGDDPRAVAAVGAALGLATGDCRGGVSPEQKLEAVADAGAGGTVVLAGDGVNDAAALGAAGVGIAVHGGAEAALAAADVFSARPGLQPLVDLLDGASRVMRVIHRNLAFSLVYNIAGATLAMAGLIDPLVAAVLMPASSLTVIIASYRARIFRGGAS